MRLSRTNMPLASSDSVISQLTYAVFLDNLAPHLRAENPDHKLFCHSQPQNPPQLSKSGLISFSGPSGCNNKLHQTLYVAVWISSVLLRRKALVHGNTFGFCF